jgi:hypothetical protein
MTGSCVVTSAVVAGPHLGTDAPSVAIDDEAEDHLVEVRAVVLGIAALAEALATLAVE